MYIVCNVYIHMTYMYVLCMYMYIHITDQYVHQKDRKLPKSLIVSVGDGA